MRKLRGLSVMTVACILGLSLVGLITSPPTAAKSAGNVVLDTSTELALLNGGELEVLSVQCAHLCLPPYEDCLTSNCGVANPSCCCKWCNGSLDCRAKGLPGFCVAE